MVRSPQGGMVAAVWGKDGKWHIQGQSRKGSTRKSTNSGNQRVRSNGSQLNSNDAMNLQVAQLERQANSVQTASTFTQNARGSGLSDQQRVGAVNRMLGYPAPRGGIIGGKASMKFGSSEAGNAWVDCLLHPCMEPSPSPKGVPDRSSAMIVSPLFKYSTNVGKPEAVSAPNGIWDLQVLLLPIPELDFVYRGRNPGGAWSNWYVVYAANFGQAGTDGSANTLETQGYGSQRIIGRGHTMHLRASGTTNQGTVFGGQVHSLDWVRDYDTGFNGAQGTPPSRYAQHRVPINPAELTALDPAVVEWEAWNGLYMPLRFAENTWRYEVAAPGAPVLYSGAGASPTSGYLPGSWIQIADSSAASPSAVNLPQTPTYTLPSEAPTVGGAIIYGTSDATPFLTGVAFFEGISTEASVQIKSRIYMENQLEASTYGVNAAGTALRAFAEPSPIYDWAALEVAATVSQAGPHAYPASANDFSTVMGSIWNTLKSVGKHVVGALDIASGLGLPFAGPIAGVAHAIGL